MVPTLFYILTASKGNGWHFYTNKMKKALIPFLVAGMLSTTSCTELFEPSIDYGDQTYINDYSALVTAVNDLNKSIGERFEALNTLLEKNMVDIKLSIDANTGAIKAVGESMENSLSTINTTLFNGFTALNTQIDGMGNKIVTAINAQGDVLQVAIKENGTLISTEIKNLQDVYKTVAEKFDALNALLEKNMADIKLSIDANTGAIKAVEENMENSLSTINATLFDGFTALNTQIDGMGNKIVTAINAQGDILKAAIEENGTLVSTEIKDFKDAYETAEAANLAKMGEIVGAINELTKANNANSAALVTKLEQLLSDNGIYYDENNPEQMYMTPENFASIQDAGPTSNMYKLYADQLTTLPVTFTSKQVVSANGATHEHAIFTPNTAKDAAPVLVASKAEVVDGVANGKKVVRVVKTAVNRNYTVTISTGCNTRNIFAVRLTDANGKNETTFTPTLSYDLTLIVYNKSNSVIENNINAVVYCCSGGADTTYPLVDPQ